MPVALATSRARKCMVQVEVSQHDVTHVDRGETKTPNLRECRLLRIEQRSRVQEPERPQTVSRVCQIRRAQAGVDQHQPILNLEQ